MLLLNPLRRSTDISAAGWVETSQKLLNLANRAGISYKERMQNVELIAVDFGFSLRDRRERAKMSQSALARRAGVNRATIANIEEGRTQAAPGTIRRLRAVREFEWLTIAQSDWSAADPDIWLAPLYDPLRLAADCSAMLNGPGGILEQTYVYIDGQGAVDWLAYSNSSAYVTNLRNKIPYCTVAEAIHSVLKSDTLDLVALGVGDGKTETRLVQQICEDVPDIEPTLYLSQHVVYATRKRRHPITTKWADLGWTRRKSMKYGWHRSIMRY